MKEKYTIMINRRIEKIFDNDDYIDKVKSFYKKYYLKELEDVLCQENLINIDKNRPHPEYCFNNMGIDSHYMRKIRRELKNSLKTQINYTHPFLIGIERGIIPYFKDMEVPFQRIAQSLFSNKKIPVVISDESLGFGINLPIKTVVMLGEKDTEIIDPVLANQMIGRSGRRGIDREGHVVFAGVNWKDILRNKYNKLEGMNPTNEFLPLPFYFKKYSKDDMGRLFTNTLMDYTQGNNNDKRGLILVSYGNHYIRVYRANSPRHAPTETKQHSLCNKTRHLVEVASYKAWEIWAYRTSTKLPTITEGYATLSFLVFIVLHKFNYQKETTR